MKKKENLYNPYKEKIEESFEISEILDYTDVLSTIANEMRQYRKENELTQKQLAEILNMNQTMISKLESGEYNATFKMLLKISYLLDNDSSLFIDILNKIGNTLRNKTEYKNIQIIQTYKYEISNKLVSIDEYKMMKDIKSKELIYKTNM